MPQAALVRATRYIDGRYGIRSSSASAPAATRRPWHGRGLARSTREGFAVPSDVIPDAVVNATYEAALRGARLARVALPDYVASQQVTRGEGRRHRGVLREHGAPSASTPSGRS